MPDSNRDRKAPTARSAGVVGLALVFAAVSPLAAQLAPDTPRLISPHGPGGIGLYWFRGETLPGDDNAFLVTLAPGALPEGMRLRFGGGTGAEGEIAGFGGVDLQTPMLRDAQRMPVDLDWYAGLGVGAGQYVLVTLPVGLSGAVSWSSGAVWISPYASAGLAADLRVGEEAPDREFEVHPAVDLGLDLSLDRRRRFVFRAAASLGDRQTLAAGLAIGGGASVR